MLEKNITLRGFNLEGSLRQVPQALSALFKLVGEGKLKLEITKYPLSEAAKVHQLFEARKRLGKSYSFRRNEATDPAPHINLVCPEHILGDSDSAGPQDGCRRSNYSEESHNDNMGFYLGQERPRDPKRAEY